MSDYSQKRSDEAMGQHERRMMDRARFGSPFAADLFAFGSDMAKAFAPPPIRESDPVRLASIADEVTTEGRIHRRPPAPVNIAET